MIANVNSTLKHGATVAIPSSGFKTFIISLAKRHNVTYVKTFADKWAESVTRLADDEVQMDDIERLVVALKRAGVVTGREMGALLVGYLREESAKTKHSPTNRSMSMS